MESPSWRGNAKGVSLGSQPQTAASLFSVLFSVARSLLAVAFLCLPACGQKTLVRPPELVIPKTINNLTLEVQGKGVMLRWARVQKRAGGENLDDLAGFVVLRATRDAQGKVSDFAPVGTIAVDDRERFRKRRKFSYTDEQLTIGVLYRYRVVAFTLDGYQGRASNTVEIMWPGQGQATRK